MYRIIFAVLYIGILNSCGFKSPDPLAIKNAHFKAQVQRLKALIPDSVVKRAPDYYWYYTGQGQVFRLPLVWPYSIYSVNGLGNARLYDDRAISDYKNAAKQSLMQELEYLKEFNIDGQMLIAHTSANGGFLNNNKNPMERWVVFMFYNRQVFDCESEQALFKKAKSLGYTGKDKLMSIQDYGMLFN